MKILESERALYIARKSSASGLGIDEVIAMECAKNLLSDAEGGTYDQGAAFVATLREKIEKKIPFTHSMIIFGEKFRDGENREDNIRAEDTPFNRALIDKFEIGGEPNDVVGGAVVTLGAVGLNAQMECIWDTELSQVNGGLSDNERDGLRRHLYDKDGNVVPNSGVLFLPRVALRAHLTDFPTR